jgi:hypothetical protein
VTVLRIIFIPNELEAPIWLHGFDFGSSLADMDEAFSTSQINNIRRFTCQIPIGSILDSKYQAIDMNATLLCFELKEGNNLKLFYLPIKRGENI